MVAQPVELAAQFKGMDGTGDDAQAASLASVAIDDDSALPLGHVYLPSNDRPWNPVRPNRKENA
jgi:hypothetical protein